MFIVARDGLGARGDIRAPPGGTIDSRECTDAVGFFAAGRAIPYKTVQRETVRSLAGGPERGWRAGSGHDGVFHRRSATHPDLHLHPRPKPVDDRHEAIDGEPPEVRIPDAREVGRRNALRSCAARTLKPSRSSALIISEARMALNCPRLRSCVRGRGTRCRFLAPLPASRFSWQHLLESSQTVLIRPISRCGVLMPWVDFFWNACTTQISPASCTA